MSPTTSKSSEVWMTKTTVPIPKTGIEPDTSTTSTAQERRERKASGHEHMLCPAPESTWNNTLSGKERDRVANDVTTLALGVSVVQGWHRHSGATTGAKATAALTIERVPGTLVPEGKTIRCVVVSKVAFSPVLRVSVGVLPAMHS